MNLKVSAFGLLVLHTHPGNANSLAFFLDKKYVAYSPREDKNFPILGTIAGDDTVLLIVKNKAVISEAIKLLQNDFPYLEDLDLKIMD